MALGNRLKTARTKKGLSQQQLADIVGMTQAAIGALEKRDSHQSSKVAELAKATEVNIEWLASGSGPMDRNQVAEPQATYGVSGATQPSANSDELEFFGHMDAWDSNTPLGEDEIELPLFREVELAAGGGQTQVIENHGAKLRFAKSTLSRAGVVPENAACAFVRGNSMEPVMPDGTCVGVNTGDKTIRDGEIYAIDHDGMLRVKFLHRRPGGGIKIVSQNGMEHPTEEYSVSDIAAASIRVIGRVFWWSVLR
ncbi:helix-turn-helix transcriptional regulator [Marinobacter sp. BGYM27]|uniref:XRE family transcriptional regulator n=1 Tax=Marinobacter sp. BGYM27 TaxID=2975597 RepID=UPI0021A8A871|nr:helix-turn-helix transcriptional regulator [Marinobacter sp. BGYM27]MDG5498935.1 helix-turn-helix transcriptional regulator [Marinobacter sp. BGYM27]